MGVETPRGPFLLVFWQGKQSVRIGQGRQVRAIHQEPKPSDINARFKVVRVSVKI